jgi:hypothetical protein
MKINNPKYPGQQKMTSRHGACAGEVIVKLWTKFEYNSFVREDGSPAFD